MSGQARGPGDRGRDPCEREPEEAGAQRAPALDDAALDALRQEAAAHGGPFIEPVLFRQASTVLAGMDAGWLTRVAGRRVTWWGNLDNRELWLALRAAEADAGHLEALAAERRAAQQKASEQAAAAGAAAAKAKRDAWERLRARLPVPVDVWHNWTRRHLDGYEQGGNHIVVRAALRTRRLLREAGQPLCWTPARAHELRYVEPDAGDDKRLPDCKACLRRAETLAAGSTPAPSRRPARATASPATGTGARRPASRLRGPGHHRDRRSHLANPAPLPCPRQPRPGDALA